MKVALQILGIIAALVVLGAMNACANNYKHEKCVDLGGRYVLNTSDATQSTCILGN